LQIVPIRGGSDAASFTELLEFVYKDETCNEQDIVYLLEDDYMHRPGWTHVLREGLKMADYATLYDHPDKYWMYPDLVSKIFLGTIAHWRTTPSTTNTYACTKAMLKQDYSVHMAHCDMTNGYTFDHQKFRHLWNIGRSLVSCIPGWSTHVESNMIGSPQSFWNEELSK
jgi:hypothetical protein